MKTGFDMTGDNTNDAQVDFLKKTICILKILTEESIKTAQRFVNTCGRTIVTGNDMYYALMYEAHEFFQKDFDARFYDELEDAQHLSDESDGEEDNEEINSDEVNNEVYTIECVIPQDSGFHKKVLKYATEWRDWFPEDPVHKIIKDAIDKTRTTEGGN